MVGCVGAFETILVGDDEVEVPAVAQGAIGDQAADRGQIVRLDAESVPVPPVDRDILDRGRPELG